MAGAGAGAEGCWGEFGKDVWPSSVMRVEVARLLRESQPGRVLMAGCMASTASWVRPGGSGVGVRGVVMGGGGRRLGVA